jgi:hypothetical protein
MQRPGLHLHCIGDIDGPGGQRSTDYIQNLCTILYRDMHALLAYSNLSLSYRYIRSIRTTIDVKACTTDVHQSMYAEDQGSSQPLRALTARPCTLYGTRLCVPLSAIVIMPKGPRALTAAVRR